MLADEFGTASNIKSRVNRLSVLSAITSVQQRLKVNCQSQRRPSIRGDSWLN
jgi:peptide subunit release factor 1 (eRF1)